MIISLAKINLGGGGGGGTVSIIDNLESTATTAALSANQGKVLGDHIGDAEEVLARGYNQLNNKIEQAPANSQYGAQSWQAMQYARTGFYNVEINGVSQGTRLHVISESTSEFTNPKVTEITTSATVLRIVSLTQDEYDTLEQGGQLNNNTLYVIVEPLP